MEQKQRTLQVRIAATGKMVDVPFTRAGIYNLALLISNVNTFGYDLRQVLQFFKDQPHIFSHCGFSIRDFVARVFYAKMWQFDEWAPWLDISRFFTVENMAYDCNGDFGFKEDMFSIGGNWYPLRFKKYVRYSEDFGTFFDQKLLEEDNKNSLIRRIPSSYLGYDGVSPDDVDDVYGNMRRCDDCGRWIDTSDDDSYEYVGDDLICRSCIDNGSYAQCEHCGEWFYYGDGDYVEADNGNMYCCENCAQNDGYHYSESRECWTRDPESTLMGDYHEHKGHLAPIYAPNENRKNIKQKLFIGTENECDGQCADDYDDDYWQDVLDWFNGACVLEQDGSVEFEAITHPMTEKAFFNWDWETPFNNLIRDGWRSHDTESCGKHFHFSKGYLGYTDNEQINNAKKVCYFVQKNWDEICKIARRKGNHYCMNWDFAISKKTSFSKLENTRYYAVNLQNMFHKIGTIEIRICKGTLKAKTMLASADFFLHIVRNAKRIAWKNIDNLKLWFKGIKNQNTIDYIKARHAFASEF